MESPVLGKLEHVLRWEQLRCPPLKGPFLQMERIRVTKGFDVSHVDGHPLCWLRVHLPYLLPFEQGIVHRLVNYGVAPTSIFGVMHGLQGLTNRGSKPRILTPKDVEGIHLKGGSILGMSQ